MSSIDPTGIQGNDPFARLKDVPEFTVTSTTVQHGQEWPAAQYSEGSGHEGAQDVSPQLSWSGAPEGTKSYAVTIVDPDAPTMTGFRHWSVVNIPADVTELAEGAGSADGSTLPQGAFQLDHDGGAPGFTGAAPPEGHGPHRYFIVVFALDTEDLGIDQDATGTFFGFNLFDHTIGRASMVVTGETTE